MTSTTSPSENIISLIRNMQDNINRHATELEIDNADSKIIDETVYTPLKDLINKLDQRIQQNLNDFINTFIEKDNKIQQELNKIESTIIDKKRKYESVLQLYLLQINTIRVYILLHQKKEDKQSVKELNTIFEAIEEKIKVVNTVLVDAINNASNGSDVQQLIESDNPTSLVEKQTTERSIELLTNIVDSEEIVVSLVESVKPVEPVKNDEPQPEPKSTPTPIQSGGYVYKSDKKSEDDNKNKIQSIIKILIEKIYKDGGFNEDLIIKYVMNSIIMNEYINNIKDDETEIKKNIDIINKAIKTINTNKKIDPKSKSIQIKRLEDKIKSLKDKIELLKKNQEPAEKPAAEKSAAELPAKKQPTTPKPTSPKPTSSKPTSSKPTSPKPTSPKLQSASNLMLSDNFDIAKYDMKQLNDKLVELKELNEYLNKEIKNGTQKKEDNEKTLKNFASDIKIIEDRIKELETAKKNKYYAKYLKYKSKYLALKNN